MPRPQNGESSTRGDAERHPTSILWRPVLVVWMMLLTLNFGINIATAPQTRIYEDIICRQYYSRNPSPSHYDLRQGPDESRCKAPAIQDAVNELFGWQTFFDGIPGLLLAMYYGSLADTKGRRPILIMSLLGQVLAAAYILFICWIEANIRLIWLSSIFTLSGGGNTVFTAASMMILADVTPDVSRSRIFFYASTFFIGGQMLGPPLGAVLMERNPWIPNVIGFLCMVITTSLACLAPETLNREKSADRDGATPKIDAGGLLSAVTGRVRVVLEHAVRTLGFVFRDRNLALLVITYFTVDFARETLSLIVRYMSARFNIPLAQVCASPLFVLQFEARWYARIWWLIRLFQKGKLHTFVQGHRASHCVCRPPAAI